MKHTHPWLAGLSLALLGAGIAIGQLATASLSGVVADSSGAPIPGVELKATHIETNRDFRVSTGESGGYTLLTLPTGRYKITAGIRSWAICGATSWPK